MKKMLLAFATATSASMAFVSSSQAAIVLSDSFEAGANPYGGTTPDVATYTVANTSGQANATLWVRATNGFNASRGGLIDDLGTDNGLFSDPVGQQAYGFRYTNSGLTSAFGEVGTLAAGDTVSVSFDVVADGWDSDGNAAGVQAGLAYEAAIVLFDGAGTRNALNGDISINTAAVLKRVTGNATSDGLYTTVSFIYVVGDNVVDNNGAGAGVATTWLPALLGKDIAVRFKGYTSSANIDNVTVSIVPEPASLGLLGLGGLLIGCRRR